MNSTRRLHTTPKLYAASPRFPALLILGVFCFASSLPAEEETPSPPPNEMGTSYDADPDAWTELLEKKNLEDWKIVEKWDFAKHGKIGFEKGILRFDAGKPFTGLRYIGEKKLPRINYEIIFEAKKTGGDDFFIGVVFPVGEEYLSFVAGGWGGTIVGLTNLDGEPAVENESCDVMDFRTDHWYTFRLRVSEEWIELWIEDEEKSRKMIDIDHQRFQLSLYWEQEPLRPFGVSCWRTASAYRSIRFRDLEPEELRQIKREHELQKEKARQRHHDYRPRVTRFPPHGNRKAQ